MLHTIKNAVFLINVWLRILPDCFPFSILRGICTFDWDGGDLWILYGDVYAILPSMVFGLC